MLGAAAGGMRLQPGTPCSPSSLHRIPASPTPVGGVCSHGIENVFFLIILNAENRRKKTGQGHVHSAPQVWPPARLASYPVQEVTTAAPAPVPQELSGTHAGAPAASLQS